MLCRLGGDGDDFYYYFLAIVRTQAFSPCGEFELLKFFFLIFKKSLYGASLAVQWLRSHASNAGGTGSMLGQGTETLHAMW